jgi:hypothetical protein
MNTLAPQWAENFLITSFSGWIMLSGISINPELENVNLEDREADGLHPA